jgi:hypothetical protein
MLKAGCAPCALGRTRRGAQAGHRQAELRKYRDQLTSSASPEPQVASHELVRPDQPHCDRHRRLYRIAHVFGE